MNLSFNNLGHAIATGAKYFVQGLEDVLKVAGKAQAAAPEIDLLVGALAGPQAAKISDLAFHALGDVAAALGKVDVSAKAANDQQLLSVSMDVATINDIKSVVTLIEALIKAKGGALPA